ncbi:MAG: DUF523 domain-containing protein [Gammaproteobacteria bacterium]|nr:DUF523 domain-containing protein [Gammaproteobacteria bacterium]
MKIVSACLAGIKCNYLGEARPCAKVIDLVCKGKAIPVCPEQLGGMTTPREASEQRGDRIFTSSGKDVTDNFEFGAKEGLKIAELIGCKDAILKARSPSCGSRKISGDTFTTGEGVFAKLLKRNGINVVSEEELL